MNELIILTDKYPYGNGETYIETERPYWSKFDRVFICPVLARKEDEIRDNFKALPYETIVNTVDCKPGFFEAIFGLLGSIRIRDYYQEIITLKKSNRLTVQRIKYLLFVGIL